MTEVPDTGVRAAPTAPPPTPPTAPSPAAVGYARLTGLLGVAFAVLLAVGLLLVSRSPSLTASDAAYGAFYGVMRTKPPSGSARSMSKALNPGEEVDVPADMTRLTPNAGSP